MTVDNTMTAESPPPVTPQKDNRPTAFIPYSDEPPPSPDIEPSAVLEQQRLLMEGYYLSFYLIFLLLFHTKSIHVFFQTSIRRHLKYR